ncbi:MAG: YqaA family protein [Terriglobales bacterium]
MKIKVLIALAQSLGVAGVFGLAFFDSSLLFALPGMNDLVLILFVASKASWGWALASATMATVGSVLGARLTYRISHKGGAELLKRRMPKAIRDRVLQWTHRYGALPVGIAAVLPPPFPYAPFVISAGVIDVPRRRFSLSVGLGRGIRYFLEAELAMLLGRRLVRHLDAIYWNALKGLAVGIAILIALWLLYRFLHRRPSDDVIEK